MKEVGVKTCDATYRNVIEGGVAEVGGRVLRSRSQKGSKVNVELVQGQFTFLSGG